MHPDRETIIEWLSTEPLDDLRARADALRREIAGDVLHVRGLIEISNHCRCSCTYCGLRPENRQLTRYRMPVDEIVATARKAYETGFKTIVLQSGEDPHFSGKRVTDLVRRIKSETGCAITLSLGEWSREEYEAWHEAGADRYLLKHETINPELYARLHPGLSQQNRLNCLRILREIGYQVGSGAMIGLPGQTLGDLADDLLFCSSLECDMAGFGPFISHPGTPLAGAPNGSTELTLRVLAAARLVLRETHLPATTSLVVLDKTMRVKALRSGANVIMPDITPAKYSLLYNIYPGKGQGDDHIEYIERAWQFANDVASEVGWVVSSEHGHSLKPGYLRR
ncbi:MAG: [FeFe] hydrogenase H-cluster radical SAM maturase HydE [Planctomycetota bacterium]